MVRCSSDEPREKRVSMIATTDFHYFFLIEEDQSCHCGIERFVFWVVLVERCLFRLGVASLIVLESPIESITCLCSLPHVPKCAMFLLLLPPLPSLDRLPSSSVSSDDRCSLLFQEESYHDAVSYDGKLHV